MLHLEGDEVESDNDNSDSSDSKSQKEENKPETKKAEEQVINNNNNINNNNKIKKDISKKISVNSSDNFFKGDSNNYDLIGINKIDSKNINNNNNNSLNKIKENSENENSEDDLNFTQMDDDKVNISNSKEKKEEEEEKKEEEKENKEINNQSVENSLENNNNLNNSENSNKLENKDNNNNNDSNNLSQKNKDNNSESSEEKDKEKNKNESSNNNKENSDENKSNKNSDDDSSSSSSSSGKSSQKKSKEKNDNPSISATNSNLEQNPNSKNKNKKEEENIINKNNQSIQLEIKDNQEDKNMNKNKQSIKSSEDEEDEEEEEQKVDNSISNENNNNNNNENIIKNNEQNNENNSEKNEENDLNNIKIHNKKTTLKLSNNDLSSIKDNNSSINKEQSSQTGSFTLSDNSNPEKEKKKKNDNKIKNKEKSENSNSSEKSQKEKKKKKDNDINENDMIKILKKMDTSNIKGKNNSNNKNISLNEITFIKDEYYINYIKLKRKGYKNIIEKNYVNGCNTFSECYQLSTQYLKDKIKQIDSLINMSICQYYNGNFNNSVTLLFNAKKIFATISLGECHISLRDKIRLGIKLYTNSIMSNLTVNNYKECIDDIKFIIDLIEQENNIEKKLELYKYTIYSLFKVETLLNIKNENEIINNIKNNFNYNSSDKNLINLNDAKNVQELNNIYIDNQNEKIMKDFLSCLKYKNFLIILNSFIENASLYKKNENLTCYYFCIFNQYLITYNNTINNTEENKEENLKEIKERLFICYKNLVGEEISNKIKEKNKIKDIIQFINEFNQKMECAFEIFSILENYEKSLINNTQVLYKEKKDDKLNKKKNYKNKYKLNEESPNLVKLCLKYSLNYLIKKKNFLLDNNTNNNNEIENKNNDSQIQDNSQEQINNLNSLINELEILIKKINSYEIDISPIKKTKLNPDIINNIKLIFENLSRINYKSLLCLNFHKFRDKSLKIKLNEIYLNIDNFLDKNYEQIIKGMTLMKINYNSKGHKYYYYSIDSDSNTLQVRKKEGDPYPIDSYNLFRDVTKITYGIRSKNLIKKLKNENENDSETRKFLRMPWKIISFILQKKSIDLYIDDNQVDTWFYGLKSFTKNDVEYKIMSTNKFLINKIKYRIGIKLKRDVDDEKIDEYKYISLIKKIIKEKAFHNITFTKLFLLYNKLIKDE